mmetsp:Transcript_31649/g.58147  ORF Transcript_31649/g.58147 Transcript_31649/m.58147 type:complete len:576 (+) Transcript_31649:74-1801(+)
MRLAVCLPLLIVVGVDAHPQLFTGVPPKKGSEIPDSFEDCGCIWHDRNGCMPSGSQIVAALGRSSITALCEQTAMRGDRSFPDTAIYDQQNVPMRTQRECLIRGRVLENHAKFKYCIGHDAEECEEDRVNSFCGWSAQESGLCGIDKERAAAQVVTPRLRSAHPLMSLVQQAIKCRELAHSQCEANNHCSYSEEGGCEISKKYMWLRVLEQPKLLGIILLIGCGAECRANYEYGTGSCSGECQNERGFCTVDPRRSEKAHTSPLVDRLCEYKYKKDGECPGSPCKMAKSMGHMPMGSLDPDEEEDNRLVCIAAESPGRDFTLNPDDWEIAQTFAVVHSALIGYERHCNLLDIDKARCTASKMNLTCANLNETWTWRGGKKGQGNEDPAPGLIGPLAELAVAVGDGVDLPQPLNNLFSAYLEEHVETDQDFKELLDAANQPSHHGGDIDDPDSMGHGGWGGGRGHGGWGGHGWSGGMTRTEPPPIHVEPKPLETKHTTIVSHIGEDKLWYIAILGIAISSLLFAGLKVWPYPPLLKFMAWLNGDRTGENSNPFTRHERLARRYAGAYPNGSSVAVA